MRVVSITSSYRRNGNTKRLVDLFEEEIIAAADEFNIPVEIDRIYLAHQNIQICRGCRICFNKGEESCPLNDDLMAIHNLLLEADGLLLASPVYVEDINGILKNWIDRMAFNSHRPAFAGKTAILAINSAVGSSNHALQSMSRALGTWGFHFSGKGKFTAGALMKKDIMKTRYEKVIKKLSRQFITALVNQEPLVPSFYSLLVFKVQQKYWQKNEIEHNTVDYAYWLNKGWLNPQSWFYFEHRASWFKAAMARLFGEVIWKIWNNLCK
jgi:multimeric flavodoxin WrbA